MTYLTDEILLRSRYAGLCEIFENTPTGDDLFFLPARSGQLTARVRTALGERFLHSAVDPYIDANAFINSALLHTQSIPLVIGFGLGYHLEELYVRHASFDRVIALEPRADMLKEACIRRDLTALFARENLAVLTGSGDEQAVGHLARIFADPVLGSRISLLVHRPSLALYENAYPRFMDLLSKTVTDTAAAHLMRENALANLDAVRDAEGVSSYAGRWAAKTAAVIGAGPSLTDAFPYLRAHRTSLCLIAVGTAVRPLLEAGIKPDVMVIADQQRIIRTHIDDARAADIPLLFIPTASHDAVAYHPGSRIVALQYGYPLCDELEAALHKGRLAVGGSVATLALSFAVLGGSRRIELIGLDLAYPGGYSHAQGVTKRVPIEATECVVSVTGGSVLSTKPMVSFRDWIAKTIAAHGEIEFVNRSAHGARIDGTREEPLAS